ncbi:uncharacterized protein [Ptychodera flava]|uniref:uncharacterized protein n=1 Tax=Ptychodera flava TaxID=63121 RepID=UPI00396A0615
MEDKLDPSVKSLKTLAVIVVLLSTMAQLCQGVGCHYKCTGCDNNQTCTECSDPYFAYNDTCYKLCSDNSSTATPGYGQTTLPVTTPTGTPPPTTSCLDECPPDYFQKGSSKRTCEPCHNQCNSSCSGPGPEDCTTCKNYIENGRCVEQCGIDTFDNGNKICVSCSTNCSVPECVDSDNCTSTTTVAPEEPESGLPLYIIIPAAAGGAVVIIVIIIIIIYCCRRRSSEDRDPEISDVNKSPVDDAAGDSNDGQHNPGCDWTDAEPATTDDVYGNVDNMGNLINIPAEQTTAEALARLSHHSAENGGAHSPSGAWGAATDEEYVNPDFNQTDDEYVNPDFQQEDYVAPDMTQQQWGQEYTALDQSTVPPELSSSVSYDKQIPVSTPENIPTTDPIYQNINAVQSATPPPPISPRHASLAGPSKTSNTKAKKPAFDSFNENELLSVPAPFPQIGSPKRDVSIELEEFKRKTSKDRKASRV